MLKGWQFDVLFVVGVGGALFLLIGPSFGMELSDNPLAYGGVGAILTYILTQAQKNRRNDEKKDRGDDDGSG